MKSNNSMYFRKLQLFCMFAFFLLTSKICYSQTIYVQAYENPITSECIEDYVEKDSFEYEGSYSFVHFGTDTYTLTSTPQSNSLHWAFANSTENDSMSFSNVRFKNNWMFAKDKSGKEFKARFVKLKCGVNEWILSGFIGLLVDEEFLYLSQGD